MIYFFSAAIFLCLFGRYVYQKSRLGSFVEFCGFMSIGFGLLMIVASGFMGFSYVVAGEKAKIINREYGTNYTQREVFYAESVIDTIREIDRKRVELNGDIMGEK